MTNTSMEKEILEALEKDCADKPHYESWHDDDVINIKAVFTSQLKQIREEIEQEIDSMTCSIKCNSQCYCKGIVRGLREATYILDSHIEKNEEEDIV